MVHPGEHGADLRNSALRHDLNGDSKARLAADMVLFMDGRPATFRILSSWRKVSKQP